MTREEKLKLAQDAFQKYEKEQEKSNNSFSRDYEDLHYTALEDNQWQLVRFMGAILPPTSKNRESTDMKEIQRSCIVDDKGKIFWCNWSYDKDWILWKIYNKVLSYTWNPDKGERGEREYHNVDKYPVLFERVRFNGKSEKVRNSFESGWRPQKHILSNIIDRRMMDWHKENKHTRLLSKKRSENDQGVSFYEAGFTPSLYKDDLYNRIIEEFGCLEDYDVALKKIKKGKDVNYTVQHSKYEQDNEDLKNIIVKGPLTEEELSWELYDLDKLFPVTSYQKIMNRLGLFIQEVDAKMGTNFYSELQRLVEDEKVKFDKIFGSVLLP